MLGEIIAEFVMLAIRHSNIQTYATYDAVYCAQQEKIGSTSHHASLPVGYFVQVVMWGDSNETCLK